MPNVGDENSTLIPRSSNWKVILTLGLIRLYQLWREAKTRKERSNATLDAKSTPQPRTPRKKSS